jgi:GAF domain
MADPEYTYRVGGYRTILGVPLLREGSPIGVIALGRNSVRPFSNKQIELVTTFADQAVIAIENVRLFEAEQQRTRELSESPEQQTATSDVLRVISSSPSDIQPVLETIGERAGKLFRQFGRHFCAVDSRRAYGLVARANSNLLLCYFCHRRSEASWSTRAATVPPAARSATAASSPLLTS